MAFANDNKNSALIIIIAIIALGGAIGSCVHFMGSSSAQPLPASSSDAPQGNLGMPGPAQGSSAIGRPALSSAGMPGPGSGH